MEVIFWVSIFIIIYSYVIFPVLIFIIASVKQGLNDVDYMYRKKNRRHRMSLKDLHVRVVLSAYNEESVIKDRVINLLSQKLDTSSYTVIVGSDGSSDNTVKQLSDIQDERLTVIDFKENRGKVNVLNDLIEQSDADILVFTDANTEFTDDNIKNLLAPFVDEDVGAVCGELKLYDKALGENKDGVYWNYERFIKYCESKLGALLGANGANYAIRRELFKPFGSKVINDDFQNVMNIAAQGKKVIYAHNSVALEEIPETKEEEYKRRVRIGNGNYLYFFNNLSLLNPRYGVLWLSYMSHKVFRWFTPHFMLLILGLNIALLDSALYQLMFLLQVIVYANSIFYRISTYRKLVPSFVGIVDMFVYMNLALLIGFIKYMSGNTRSTWGRTER